MLNMDVGEAIVSRYTRRGVPAEDLLQVAYTARTRAAHRFDPAQGTEFAAFAVPSIRGEICKHFRDHAWTVRPTRRIQELQPQINRADDALWRELGRSPQPTEVAERIGEPVDVVMEALSTDGCFSPCSLDKPGLAGESRAPLGRIVDPPIMTGWDGFEVASTIGRWYGTVAHVENDANALAVGEVAAAAEAGVSISDLLVVKVGTGVGAGIISGGRVLRGAAGAAGDIGHTEADNITGRIDRPICRCGKVGCVEVYAGAGP